jgi:hypothetical protein
MGESQQNAGPVTMNFSYEHTMVSLLPALGLQPRGDHALLLSPWPESIEDWWARGYASAEDLA